MTAINILNLILSIISERGNKLAMCKCDLRTDGLKNQTL